MTKIFFQSSLPRSGSTLLQNVMGQNPDFYVTPSSGILDLMFGARAIYNELPEFIHSKTPELHEKAFHAFCYGGLSSYVNAITDKPYFLDKNRSWGYYLPWAEQFMPYKPKTIVMVRDLRDIFASMENLFRKNPLKQKMAIWEGLKNTTVYKRIDSFSMSPPIGLAIERLEAMFTENYANKVLFVKYEDFCLRPEIEIKRIYNYLEVPYFAHNFDHVDQITFEDDTPHGVFGDHVIRNNVEMQNSKAIELLGQHGCNWIYDRYKWFFEYFRYNK